MTTSIDAGALAASLQRLRDRPDDGAVLESSLQTIVDAGAPSYDDVAGVLVEARRAVCSASTSR